MKPILNSGELYAGVDEEFIAYQHELVELGGGGVDGAIHRAAGPIIMDEEEKQIFLQMLIGIPCS